jgi:hypothetical protein
VSEKLATGRSTGKKSQRAKSFFRLMGELCESQIRQTLSRVQHHELSRIQLFAECSDTI